MSRLYIIVKFENFRFRKGPKPNRVTTADGKGFGPSLTAIFLIQAGYAYEESFGM